MTLFGRCVFIPIKTDLTNSMIALITDERESSLGDVSISMDASNQDVLRECVGMYIKMGNGTFEAYTEHFEEPLLTVTKYVTICHFFTLYCLYASKTIVI